MLPLSTVKEPAEQLQARLKEPAMQLQANEEHKSQPPHPPEARGSLERWGPFNRGAKQNRPRGTNLRSYLSTARMEASLSGESLPVLKSTWHTAEAKQATR